MMIATGRNMMQVNRAAVEHARQQVYEGRYRISSNWRESQPSAAKAQSYLQLHGPEQYRQWYLAIDSSSGAEQYVLPTGDFDTVHRSALMLAKDRAVQAGNTELEAAIEEILFLFDKLTAC
jgi:hypothetical protein